MYPLPSIPSSSKKWALGTSPRTSNQMLDWNLACTREILMVRIHRSCVSLRSGNLLGICLIVDGAFVGVGFIVFECYIGSRSRFVIYIIISQVKLGVPIRFEFSKNIDHPRRFPNNVAIFIQST
jgi:hypothetical protein